MLEEYKKLLKEFISFKTVSSDSTAKEDIKRTADWLVGQLKSAGFTVQTVKGYGNPIVRGEYTVSSKAPTVLLYGHYDVMAAEKKDGWVTPPFRLEEVRGKLFGRGVMDDKGQLLLHIITLKKLIQEDRLAYNIKIVFEGEEELGSPHIEQFVKDHVKDLTCDCVLLSDGEMILGKPTIELGNRGIVNFTLTVKTATEENHSGIYGGAVPNAIHELSKIIASLHDKSNRIAIEDLYEDVAAVDTSVHTPFDIEEYKKNTGTKALITENDFDFHTATGQRPAMTVTSIVGGYQGEGHKTTVPPVAIAKFNLRIVKDQDPKSVMTRVAKHFEKNVPSHVTYTVTFDEYAKPNKTAVDNTHVRKAEKILEELFGENVVHKYVGGTEPAISCFSEYLKKPIVSVPFANEDGHMHGINENFAIKNIENGLTFSEKFFSNS